MKWKFWKKDNSDDIERLTDSLLKITEQVEKLKDNAISSDNYDDDGSTPITPRPEKRLEYSVENVEKGYRWRYDKDGSRYCFR